MENNDTESNSTNLSELISGLRQAQAEIPSSRAKLKDKPKRAEDYLICKNDIIAETDQTGDKDGWVTIKETKV